MGSLVIAMIQVVGTGPSFERITAQPTASPIEVDGRMAETVWQMAAPIDLPYEVRPRANAAAAVNTDCRVAFDSSTLFLGCSASDEPGSLRAYFTDRDRIATHDRIVVFLDPFADGRRAFFFSVNPLGVQEDGIFDGLDGAEDLAWDAVWESAGRITGDGYVIEMAIPFTALRFPANGGARPWGFSIERRWPRTRNVVLRSVPLDPGNACKLCQSDELDGLSDVEPGLGLRLNPTLTITRTDRRLSFPDGPLEGGPVEPELGVDGRLRLTDDLSLSATANPDFSHVEADVAQLEVNEQFTLSFPEKRPFFLDGTEVLQTPIRAAYTRTVSDPRGGLSLTGKLGPVLMASLVAQDERTTVLVPGNQDSHVEVLDTPSMHAFQRVRADVGGSGTAGLLYTGRFADGYGNQVIAGDGFVRLSPLVRARAQILRSWTRDPAPMGAVSGRGAGRFSGSALYAQLRRSSFTTRRRWFGAVNLLAKSPDFRADAGFEPQVDVREISADGGWNVWSEGSPWFTRLNYWIGGHRSETWTGRLNSEEAWAWFSYEGPRQTFFWLWPRWGRRHFAGSTFDLDYWEGSLRTQPSDGATVSVTIRTGDEIDFANVRAGSGVRIGSSLDLRLGRRVDLSLKHDVRRLTVDRERVFTANLSQLRLVYNFSSRAFVRGLLQYQHIDRETATYVVEVDRTSQELFTQFLFSYRINARTGLFLGYADNREGRTPESDPRMPLTRADRSFFAKLGYAWDPGGPG